MHQRTTTVSVLTICAYPELLKLGYLLYDHVALPLPAFGIPPLLSSLGMDDADAKIAADVRNSFAALSAVSSSIDNSLLASMWQHISSSTDASVETPAMLRNVLQNLATAGAMVAACEGLAFLRQPPKVDMMGIGYRLRAALAIANSVSLPLLALPEELSILSGLPSELVDDTGQTAMNVVRAAIPDVAVLPWETVYRLKRTRLSELFRQWIASGRKTSQEGVMNDLMELAGTIDPSGVAATLTAIASNVPIGELNPVSVITGVQGAWRARGLAKKFGHLLFLSSLRRGAAVGSSRSDILQSTDGGYVRQPVPVHEQDGNMLVDAAGRELIPNIHPSWFEAAGLATVTKLVGSAAAGVYHRYSCPMAKRIGLRNIVWFSSALDASELNWLPCKLCCPGRHPTEAETDHV